MSKRISSLCVILLVLIFTLSACISPSSKEVDTEKSSEQQAIQTEKSGGVQTGTSKDTYTLNEAPMLKELVQAGKLPSLEERLPVKVDIMIEPVMEEIGQYGGDWRLAWKGIDDKWTVGKFTEEALFRFRQDGNGVEPNVAKGYDVNEDATEYTIYLRKGIKWSDGQPFTADDVIFYWEHMLIPEVFGKQLYDCYYSVDPVTGDKARCDVIKVDDYTIKVIHKYPNVLFLERVAIDNKWFFAPAHFYKNILPEFVGEEKALEIAKEWGFSDLKQFMSWIGYYYWVWPERPTLRAWVAKNDPNSERFIMERNPYYWKTDPVGNQLPYIDRIVVDRMEADHILLESLAGNIDCWAQDSSDFTILKENEKKGDYRIIKWLSANWATNVIQLNQTVEDPKLRELFQDIRFREAISVAVNREEVCEIVTNGITEPQQAAVPKGLPNYQEGWAQKWAEYDVNRANALLDEIGLKWDKDNKYRTFSDGTELILIIYTQSAGPFEELLKKYYEDVGIRTEIKQIDNALFQEMKYGNKLTATTAESISLLKLSYRPDTVVPLRVLTPWLGYYGLYNATQGAEGVKPEGDVAKLLEYWDKVISSTTNEDINKWSDEIIKLHAKNMWIIGYTGPMPQFILVKNNFRNVPEGLIYCDEFRDLGHGRPMQFFIKK
ncbi:MAG: ABC transporter substrate-binding protein [Clostridiaceae bacterium]|nr:ABC transporter substrate-binding protein [Clostridiaceae bacterium]